MYKMNFQTAKDERVINNLSTALRKTHLQRQNPTNPDNRILLHIQEVSQRKLPCLLSWSHGFEMKKSCPAKESKVITTQDADNALIVSKESSKEQLTDEQLLINQKLLESGIEDEGLGWLEKRNIFKTINVSLDTAGSERLQRSSPRLAKTSNFKPAKWIENSFESSKPEDFQNEKILRTKSNKKDLECANSRKSSCPNSNKRPNQETEESVSKSNHKVEISSCDTLKEDVGINCDSPKSSKKVHYIKIQVEEFSKEGCNSAAEDGHSVSLGKKRASQPEVEPTEAPKKLKMEEASNGVSSEEETPLKTELEMERRKHSAPFKLRDIKTIVSECEIRNKKWKETFLKYKSPTRWGIPIVRNCSEKWDGKQIPPKLLHRYQKYLTSKNLTHPVFLPVKSQSSFDLNKLNSEISSQSSIGSNSEFRDESENDIKNSSEESFIHDESNRTDVENNLNASTSVKDTSERMVLRNRSQQKTIISDEEEFSSDDSDDWLVKQKSSKKQKVNIKNKKTAEQSNKQLVLKLERCNINRGNGGSESGRKNGNKNDVSFIGGSIVSSNALNQAGGNSKSEPDPDTMVCPICSLRFKKQHIESHATECASKTYKD